MGKEARQIKEEDLQEGVEMAPVSSVGMGANGPLAFFLVASYMALEPMRKEVKEDVYFAS